MRARSSAGLAIAIALAALRLTTVGAGDAATFDTAAIAGKAHAALQAVHDREKNVGAQAAMMCRGTMTASIALGAADLEQAVPVSSETRFAIASVTKAFTGAALLKLWEAGRIDVDAPIQRYVPDFPAKSEGVITARLLAAHLSGIRHYTTERTPAFYATHHDDVRDILPVFANDALVSPPGTKYSYSSYGYNLLAAAIETAAGMTFQDYVRTSLLEPLQLRHTAFLDVRFVTPHIARKYSIYDPYTGAEQTRLMRVPDWDYSFNIAGGGLISTAEDLVRFGRAFATGRFFSAESRQRAQTPVTIGAVGSPWSVGWFVRRDKAGRHYLQITGAFAGVQAGLIVYPADDVEVAVLSNTWGVGSRSAEMVIGLPESMANFCLEPSPARR